MGASSISKGAHEGRTHGWMDEKSKSKKEELIRVAGDGDGPES
jgi:hypothetical protein